MIPHDITASGTVEMSCKKTGYKAVVEFKSKPYIGGEYNVIVGSIQHNVNSMKTSLFSFCSQGEIIGTLQGKWDGRIEITMNNETEVLWEPTPGTSFALLSLRSTREARSRRLPLHVPEKMKEYESQVLWAKVSQAIKNQDQVAATEEKTALEQAQRYSKLYVHLLNFIF